MTQPASISADYTLRPSELASVLAILVEARQPTVVWGPPGAAKSMIAQQVAAAANRQYVDVRALLLDPVDLRGIPWRDGADRTRWAPPAFLPPSDDTGLLAHQPRGASVRRADGPGSLVPARSRPQGRRIRAPRGRLAHRLRQPRDRPRRRAPHADAAQQSRFVHLEIRVDAEDWLAWGAANGIAPEVLFFITYEPNLLHQFDPQSKETARFRVTTQLGAMLSST